MKMKVTGILLGGILLIALIFSAGCIDSTQQPSLEGTWILDSNPHVSIIFEKDGSFGGQAPINQYGGTYIISGNSLSFGNDMVNTLMAGSSEDMAAESTFFKNLISTVSYAIVDSELKLFDENGQTLLIFKPASAISVLSTSVPNALSLPDGDSWILKENPSVTLVFNADGSYAGQAHINTYGGNYSLRASETEPRGFLIFNKPFSTKMGGSKNDMNAENAYFNKFPQVVSYTVANSELTLSDENGQTLLTFIKG